MTDEVTPWFTHAQPVHAGGTAELVDALKAQNRAMLEALEKIASGTEDRLPPHRSMGPDQMQRVARDALKAAKGKAPDPLGDFAEDLAGIKRGQA